MGYASSAGGLLVPQREAQREQRQMLEELERVTGALAHYNRELKLIDEHLSVVLAKPTTTVVGLKPGYYHIVRMNPGHAAYIKPIEGPDGEWRDLGSDIFDMVAEEDLWNDRTQRVRRDRALAARAAADREILRQRQNRAAEFDERWKSVNSTSIRVPKDV